jgi:hypothetical protein
MKTAEPMLVSPPDHGASRGQNPVEISYCEVAAIASTLSRRISALAHNKSAAERRRLRVYEDVARKIHVGLAHVGIR